MVMSSRWSRLASSLGLLVVAGAAALALGWYKASGLVSSDDQVRWAALSLGGTAAFCTAMILWVLAGRRMVAFRTMELAPALERWASPVPEPQPLPAVPDYFVANGTMVRYHRPSCPLVAGKQAEPAERADHEAAGRRPCGVCAP